MASISILPGNTNLWIAQAIARDNPGAVVTESATAIIVRAERKLEIDRLSVEGAAGKHLDDSVWQSFTLNRQGRVTRANEMRIVIED